MFQSDFHKSANRRNATSDAVGKLVFELSKLPGIGEKTATRLAYFILKQDLSYAKSLSEAVLAAKQRTGLCVVCFNFSDDERCTICSQMHRDVSRICVVERPSEIGAIEGTGVFSGFYHVLHGALSPLDGIGPGDLRIEELIQRIQKSNGIISEVILATNPSVEGEATSMYLTQQLKRCGVKITKLAHGLPIGGMLEYIDRLTVGKAIENRTEMT